MTPNSLALVVLALSWGATVRAAADPPASTTLTVNATGLESNAGDVRLALYDSPAGYQGTKPPFRVARGAIAGGHAQVVLRDLPAGTYAIALFHDRNGNGKLDRGFLGRPLEPYGFSNNVRATMKSPAFADASFTLPDAGPTLDIRVE